MTASTLNLLMASAAICAWLVLVWVTFARTRRASPVSATAQNSMAVVYASQTGTAREIAASTVQALGTDRAVMLSMDQISPQQLLNHECVLFVASTYGEGDPPDAAQAFYRKACEADAPRLDHLKTAVLALGDSSYQNFCGFGQTLAHWLSRQGATLLFPTVLADQCDPAALSAWSDALNQEFQTVSTVEKQYSTWRLKNRQHTNPGSQGGACYELDVEPAEGTQPAWQAGDITEVEITPYGVHREYSIASIPAEGVLKLLLRQRKDDQGQLGLGSRWLTQELSVGDMARMHIRANTLFHAPEQNCPAIFIGNGTGIAGLRSLLKQRLAQGHHENWLIFGERQQAFDFPYQDELQTWLAQEKLTRLDLAFSRDQTTKRYVHHILAEQAATFKAWLDRGAIVYLCGSKNGMAQDVDHALRRILGTDGYEALMARQAYRRDVY